jgi:hypothetical protein
MQLHWLGFIFEEGVYLRGSGHTKIPTLLPRSAKCRSTPFQHLLVLALISRGGTLLLRGSIETLRNKAGKDAANS